MAISPSLKYTLARLKPLASPWVIAPSVIGFLMMLFLWEYATNPQRFGGYRAAEDASQADLTGLTPEEQALLANIDNIASLQRGLAAEGAEGTVPLLSQIETDPSLLQQLLGSAPGDSAPEATASPLAQYLDQYRFLGAAGNGNRSGNGSTQAGQNLVGTTPYSTLLNQSRWADSSTASGTASGPGEGQGTTTRPLSPLEAVMQQQYREGQTSGNTANEDNRANGSTARDSSQRPASADGRPPSAFLPGVGSFLPTTPQMSPPPGTTGYTPPANWSPPTVPTAPSANGVPGAPQTPLNLSPGASNVGGGTVLPTVPGANSYGAPTLSVPAPSAQYSAPPGTYVGDGYINTFSNPSALP